MPRVAAAPAASAALVTALALAACVPAAAPRPDLTTTAEATAYARTGRYDEAVRLCRDLDRAYAEARCVRLGDTGQGRPLVALQLERRAGAPTVLIQAGIHAGEIEGKDAGFALLRDVLAGTALPGLLDRVSIVFVPVLNPDGHERFGPNHRPNQRGPVEMGFRTTGDRQNLNRDYVKSDAPEMRALLRVITELDPVMLIDLHTTDGAKFEHDVSVTVNPVAPRPDRLDEAAAALSARVQARLAALGHLPVDFYPSFLDDDNPGSGFAMGEAAPRFSNAYMAARGRLGVLVEMHSWRTYAERARAATHTLRVLLDEAATHGVAWRALADDVDRTEAALGGAEVALAWAHTAASRPIEFRGYAYEIRVSELTGGTWLVYDETTPEIWRVPLHDQLAPTLTVTAPTGGYVVDGGHARATAEVLARHGIAFTRLDAPGPLDLEVFRATQVTFASAPYEGRTRVTVAGAWAPERRTLDHGAIFVPIAQPRARLAMHLLEPRAPDALAAWGFYSAVFEHKEYLEPYVAEEEARAMFARDPALRDAFDAFVAARPGVTTADKLAWIARHHPSWDERVDLLPVYRTAHDLRRPAQTPR